MKYDLDCIRAVLLYLEENLKITKTKDKKNIWFFEHSKIGIQQVCEALSENFGFADVVYSIEKLDEAGYITILKYKERIPHDDNFPIDDKAFSFYEIVSITYDGHEFLEGIKLQKNFDKVKEKLVKAGCGALSFASTIAQSVGMEFLMEKIQSIT